MHVLIVAKHREDFERTVAECSDYDRKHNEYVHVTRKEEMRGYRMPIGIRFVGNWWELDDAPTLEFYAHHIVSATPAGAGAADPHG